MNEIVLKIRYNDDTGKDLIELVELLREEYRPGWHTQVPGWRSGKKALSERAIALMLYGARKLREDSRVEGGSASPVASNKVSEVVEENPFG